MPRRTEIPLREKEIGKRILFFRSALGLTQIEFAKKAAMERPSLSKYELGLAPLSWRAAEFLFKTFHLSATWLATGSGPIEPYLPPETLPSREEIDRLPFSDVFDRFFRPEISTELKKSGGSKIGIDVRPSKTGTSYEAFRSFLSRYEDAYLEIKHVEDRKAFALAIINAADPFLLKMYRDKTIPSLHIRETRDR